VELEPRTTAPAHATGAVQFVPLSAIVEDATFRLRDEGDVAALAASIGPLGHLAPVELRPAPGTAEGGPRWQVVAGFRRLAALRLLARERVLARVHQTLEDEDAWGIALGQALLAEPLLASELERLRDRLDEARVAPWAAEALEEAMARAPVDPRVRERFLEYLRQEPEAEGSAEPAETEEVEELAPTAPGEEPVEVTPEELADDVARRLYELNQDLQVAVESWAELPAEGRGAIVEQVRWIAELLPLLEEEP